MEPTDTVNEEEMPLPTGITLDPSLVIKHLQMRASGVIQNLTWDVALRDATIEEMQARLQEETAMRQETEGALEVLMQDRDRAQNDLETAHTELEEAREQISKLVQGESFLLGQVEKLTDRAVKAEGLDQDQQQDAFLEAPGFAAGNAELDTEPVPVTR